MWSAFPISKNKKVGGHILTNKQKKMIKVKKFIKLALPVIAIFGVLGFGVLGASAQTATTAEEVLEQIGGSVIDTGVSFLTLIFTTYFPYVLAGIVILSLVSLILGWVSGAMRRRK